MENNPDECSYKRIMLLDDNEMDNFINEKIIKANKFATHVFVHSSALNALEFFKNLIRLGEESLLLYPEVILIDLNMPLMDGFQFIGHLNNLPNDVKPKLVILTSSMHKEDEYKANGISEDIVFLRKPLTEDMLALL